MVRGPFAVHVLRLRLLGVLLSSECFFTPHQYLHFVHRPRAYGWLFSEKNNWVGHTWCIGNLRIKSLTVGIPILNTDAGYRRHKVGNPAWLAVKIGGWGLEIGWGRVYFWLC